MSADKRKIQIAAAENVIEAIVAMAQEQKPLMQRVLPQEEDIKWWAHYPKFDARSKKCQSRWYYHVHKPGTRSDDEHGHFHLFLDKTQIKKASRSVAKPDYSKNKKKARVSHLVALSIDKQGIPREWFTTNRWVTDEWMYPAKVMVDHIPLYDVDDTQEDKWVNKLITSMVQLYSDEIEEMLYERDAKLKEIGANRNNIELYNKGNEVLSSRKIDLDAKIESLED